MINLLDKTIRTYIWMGLLLYAIMLSLWGNVNTYYNILNVFTFASYAFLLWTSANKPEEYYSNKRLGITVFLYSIFFVMMYMNMCNYYEGNTFIFNKADSIKYINYSDKLVSIPLENWFPISDVLRLKYDDWGCPVFQSMLKMIIPSRYFVNFIYIVLGVTSSILMFSIGRILMQPRYAYLAALSFAIGSYSMYFYGTYLKEIVMVTIVLICFRIFYIFIEKERLGSFGLCIAISLALFFFRPVVAMFFWLSVSTVFLYGKKDKAYLLFIIVFLVFISAWSSFAAMDASHNYTHDGDITTTANYVETSTFAIMTSTISAFWGPFPNLMQLNKVLNPTAIYGSGLLFKCLLVVPFYKGLIYAIRNKVVYVIPLFVFCLIEMMSLAYVNDGLELRKGFPHVAIYILAAFWFVSLYDENATEEDYQSNYYRWFDRLFNINIGSMLIITFVWTALRQLI